MDDLLRTLASVSPDSRVVVLGLEAPGVIADVARLGFDVWACGPEGVDTARAHLADVRDDARERVTSAHLAALGYPDRFADWVVIPDLADASPLAEARRVLRPGAWIWVGSSLAPEVLGAMAREAGLAVAQAPREDGGRTRAIFRRTEPGTVA